MFALGVFSYAPSIALPPSQGKDAWPILPVGVPPDPQLELLRSSEKK